jgi:hypothetical protein
MQRLLTEVLSRGATVQVLLPEPTGPFLSDVEEFEAVHVSRGLALETEVELVRTRLLEALSEAATTCVRTGATLGRVEIGYFTTHLRSTMIICDDTWGWLTVTLPPFRATETMSMELEPNEPRSLLRTCIAHFVRTWSIIDSRGAVQALSPVVRG